ncbi:MFS transporter [Neobacillus massiliamazoniensis]|uniref:Putative transport Protein (Major Facilitator Superfamily) n=1 Tax=Neobacillus massiliamazoniensis TaxID=1499688 RepID=A0A0U1P2X4_9BACI|nr:MFS transporter [Neobacillus massiliamazoniensis]CRK84610.1 putative transport Protein (Major Facilitator Superfamily) [Neobacillus massiliamazoniensis]
MSVSQREIKKQSEEVTSLPKARSSKEVLLISALMAGYSMVYMDKNMISTAIIPISGQFHLSTSQTGMIMSLFFLGYSLMQIPGGWLADKIGYKKVLMLSLSLITLFSFAFGFSASLMVFILIRFMAGVGHAGYPPSCSKGIAENFSKERRTFVQSLILSTSGIGGILAFIIGARLIAVNWHYAYYALGALFAISLILVAIFVPNKISAEKMKVQTKQVSFKTVVTNRNVMILFIAMLLANIAFYGNMSWLPSFLKVKFSLSISTVGTILAINAVGGTIASLFAGALLTKYFNGKEKVLLLSCCVLSCLLFLGLVFTNSLALSIVFLYVLTFLLTSIFVGIFSWPHKILPEKVIGSSIGIVNTGGTLGGFIAPMTFGALISMAHGSFSIVFITLAVAIVLCGLIALTVKTEK